MNRKNMDRRHFIGTATAGSLGAVAMSSIPFAGMSSGVTGKLAILGGEPVRKNKLWLKWPYVDEDIVTRISQTTRSGIWCRIDSATGTVPTFEKEYAALMGTKYCVGTGSGTQALHSSVEAL